MHAKSCKIHVECPCKLKNPHIEDLLNYFSVCGRAELKKLNVTECTYSWSSL